MKVKLLSDEFGVFELWVKERFRLCWELKGVGDGVVMLEQANKYLLGDV